jgi:hypothetical protein
MDGWQRVLMEYSKQEIQKHTGNLVINLLNEELSFTGFWNSLSFDPEQDIEELLSLTIHAVQHFEDDQDICAKDSEYDTHLKNQLRSMANDLICSNKLNIDKYKFVKPKTNRLLRLISSVISLMKKK